MLAQTLRAHFVPAVLALLATLLTLGGASGCMGKMWDPNQDPDFLDRAQEQGVIIGDVAEGAIFRHASGLEFLVLCPLVEDFAKLADEAALIAYTRRAKREQRPSGSLPAVSVKLAS